MKNRIRIEDNLGTFRAVKTTLSDGSVVASVDYVTPYGHEPVAEPPSVKCAEELALALNDVRCAYLDCDSDLAVSLLSAKLIRAMSEE